MAIWGDLKSPLSHGGDGADRARPTFTIALPSCSADAITGSITVGAKLVTTGRANFRETGSSTGKVLRQLAAGVTVTALDGAAKNGYYKVEHDGDSGWVFGTLLKKDAGATGGTTGTTGGSAAATVVERSVTDGRWEGSTAVLKTFGVDVGFKRLSSGKVNCNASYGDAQNVTITLEK